MLLNQYGQRSCPPMIYIMYLKKLLQSKKIYISRITDKCITPVLTVDKSTKALLIENVKHVCNTCNSIGRSVAERFL